MINIKYNSNQPILNMTTTKEIQNDTDFECAFSRYKHILVFVDDQLSDIYQSLHREIADIRSNFCGIVLTRATQINTITVTTDTIIYLCGNIDHNISEIIHVDNLMIRVISEISYNYDDDSNLYKCVRLGQVPINVHNVGVFFKNFFDPSKDYFDLISTQHQFQTLTESNKASNAFRTGIYLSKVEEISGDEVGFNLLRCSSNFRGPTDNFRETDIEVIGQVNQASQAFFSDRAELNHVLAQIYQNKLTEDGTKQKKATISEHSDKTKDMPRNGLMAFCTFCKGYANGTFYDTDLMRFIEKSSTDPYDYCYKSMSALTRLRFRLKPMITDPTLTKEFDVILYPNSVFITSLSTNRMYTHQIMASPLPIDRIPTRMGYVIRCSKTQAVFSDGQTYIVDGDSHEKVQLVRPTDLDVKGLKDLYFKENSTADIIHYGNVYFSLNDGDYERPFV